MWLCDQGHLTENAKICTCCGSLIEHKYIPDMVVCSVCGAYNVKSDGACCVCKAELVPVTQLVKVNNSKDVSTFELMDYQSATIKYTGALKVVIADNVRKFDNSNKVIELLNTSYTVGPAFSGGISENISVYSTNLDPAHCMICRNKDTGYELLVRSDKNNVSLNGVLVKKGVPTSIKPEDEVLLDKVILLKFLKV